MGSKGLLRRRDFVLCLIAVVVAMTLFTDSAFAATVYKQKGNALAAYKTKEYKLCYNQNLTIKKKYKYKKCKATTLTEKKGHPALFKSWAYLHDLGVRNPQSVAVTPDGHYAFIMTCRKGSAKEEKNWKGRVYKLDLFKLQKKYRKDLKKLTYMKLKKTDTDCVQIGPEFKVGHGQAMAYNPATGELWYSQNLKLVNTNLVRIDQDTLLPDKEIRFKLKSSVRMGSNLAFDSEGNCYFYTKSNGSKWAPKNTIKIYRGQIDEDSVSFELIMQGLRYPPGQVPQSIGYNPASNRLYLINDGEIISVPVDKLGKLTKADVRTTVFKHRNREFEGLTFTEDGEGYFITNRSEELMKVEKGF